MIEVFVHGFILALGLILPLGVQNIFVFNQGVTQPRFIQALPVVITAAICDTILITLAVFGVSVLVLSVSWLEIVLIVLGVLFLIYMGVVTWRSKDENISENGTVITAKKQIAFAATVSLLNPHAILDTVGVIGTSSIAYTGVDKLVFTITCIAVSWLWFLGLALTGSQTRKLNSSAQFIPLLNKISAFIMWGTAVYLILSLVD